MRHQVLLVLLLATALSQSACSKWFKFEEKKQEAVPVSQPTNPQTPPEAAPTPPKPVAPPAPEKQTQWSSLLGIRFAAFNDCVYSEVSQTADHPSDHIYGDLNSVTGTLTCGERPLFIAKRIFVLDDKVLGRVLADDLELWLSKRQPVTIWRGQSLRSDVSGFSGTQTDAESNSIEEHYFVDDTRGLLNLAFYQYNDTTEPESRNLGTIKSSLAMDLLAPTISSITTPERETVKTGEDWLIEVQTSDDLLGVVSNSPLMFHMHDGIDDIPAPERPTDMTTWLGYDIPHRIDTYSPAYGFPAFPCGTSLGIDGNGLLSLAFHIPTHANPQRIVLGGLRVADSWGHSTRISLDPTDNGTVNYQANYRVIEGHASTQMRKLKVQIEKATPQESVDLNPPHLVDIFPNPEGQPFFTISVGEISAYHVLRTELSVDGAPHVCAPAISSGMSLRPDQQSNLVIPSDCVKDGQRHIVRVSRLLLMDHLGNVNDVRDFSRYPNVKNGIEIGPGSF